MMECIATLESSYSQYKMKRRCRIDELQKMEREHTAFFSDLGQFYFGDLRVVPEYLTALLCKVRLWASSLGTTWELGRAIESQTY